MFPRSGSGVVYLTEDNAQGLRYRFLLSIALNHYDRAPSRAMGRRVTRIFGDIPTETLSSAPATPLRDDLATLAGSTGVPAQGGGATDGTGSSFEDIP